jgi:DNA-binding IclR family transcriptional regulator
MQTDRSASVKSAERVIDLLEHLAAHPLGRSHSEIAAALGIPKGSLTPLLRNLVARGWLRLDRGSYALGEAALSLSQRATGLAGLLEAAPAILRRLTAETEESSSLNLRRGAEVEVVSGANSTLPLLYAMRPGHSAPLYAVSGGKAMLAALPPAEREAYLAEVAFTPVTPKTLTSPEALRRELAAAAAEGVAYSFEEFTPGIIGMGAAVLRPDGYPAASVNVAIPSVRFGPAKRAQCAEALREAAAALAVRLAAAPAAGLREGA